MTNKRIFISLLLLALVIAGYFLLRRDSSTTLSSEETAFAVEDVSKIDKIFLRSRYQNTSAILTKNSAGKWFINDKYEADLAKVNVLLTSIREVRVKFPVTKDHWEVVIRNLSSKGTKVELYSGGKNLKTYYVGGPTPDHHGTYLWMENAERPYVAHIEGFRGYLTPRFFVNEKDWRSKIIFAHEPQDIEWIKVEWTEDAGQSFVIKNEGETPVLESPATASLGKLNENKIRSYLSYFDRLAYEGFPIDMRAKQIDSVFNQTQPFFILTVKPKGEQEKVLQFHRKGLKADSYLQLDKEGVQLPYEIDNYYAFLNGNAQELLQVQDFVFGKVMKKTADFALE